ncbi:MAG TPA: Yip1 family protein [Chitinophagaceae bacterium]|jgi:hypothetical protein|nr:Yip1 family protein [Chitinophagaceae bacterium]
MNLFDRAKNIIVSPNTEWNVIAAEQPDAPKIITGYVLPLAGLAAAAAFIGYGLIGFNVLGYRMSGVNWGLYQALSVLISAIVSVYVSAFVIDALAPNFGSEKNLARSVQLVAYSFTPAWIGGMLSIFPALAFLGGLFALYGLYLLYLGMPKLKRTPTDKQTTYFIVSLVAIIVVYLVIGWILTSILMNLFGLSYSSGFRM